MKQTNKQNKKWNTNENVGVETNHIKIFAKSLIHNNFGLSKV